jgi:excisionase family DNA binding protein
MMRTPAAENVVRMPVVGVGGGPEPTVKALSPTLIIHVGDVMPRIHIKPPPRWATLREASEYSHVPKRTVYDWISRGDLHATRLCKIIHVDLNELDAMRTNALSGVWVGAEGSR